MATSAMETVRAAMIVELQKIIAGATYRNTVKKVYGDMPQVIPDYPSIIFQFGPGTVKVQDQAWALFDIFIPFGIICEISADTSTSETSNIIAAQDSLLHDVLMILAPLYKDHLVTGTTRWNVHNDPPVKWTPIYPVGQNAAEFTVYGTIRIFKLDGTFV